MITTIKIDNISWGGRSGNCSYTSSTQTAHVSSKGLIMDFETVIHALLWYFNEAVPAQNEGSRPCVTDKIMNIMRGHIPAASTSNDSDDQFIARIDFETLLKRMTRSERMILFTLATSGERDAQQRVFEEITTRYSMAVNYREETAALKAKDGGKAFILNQILWSILGKFENILKSEDYVRQSYFGKYAK